MVSTVSRFNDVCGLKGQDEIKTLTRPLFLLSLEYFTTAAQRSEPAGEAAATPPPVCPPSDLINRPPEHQRDVAGWLCTQLQIPIQT